MSRLLSSTTLSHSHSLHRGHVGLHGHRNLSRHISTENALWQLHHIVGCWQHLMMASIDQTPEDQDCTPATVFSEHDSKKNGGHCTPPHSQYLDFPAELRNNIYRLCLIDRSNFSIRVYDSFKFPALLQVNSQIRSEASSIFLLEHQFRLDFSDLDCSRYMAFIKRTIASQYLDKLRRAGRMYAIVPAATLMVWSNLVDWLREFYEDERTLRPRVTDLGLRRDTVAHAFDIVAQMRTKLQWEDIVKLLEVYKVAMEQQACGVWRWT